MKAVRPVLTTVTPPPTGDPHPVRSASRRPDLADFILLGTATLVTGGLLLGTLALMF